MQIRLSFRIMISEHWNAELCSNDPSVSSEFWWWHAKLVIWFCHFCGTWLQILWWLKRSSTFIKGNGSLTKIVCTQPRRISAISIAERVASERGESFPAGVRNKSTTAGSVGFQIRLSSVIPRWHIWLAELFALLACIFQRGSVDSIDYVSTNSFPNI